MARWAAVSPGSWSYRPEAKRDLRLDLLRGFAVFAMVADHVAGPSPLHTITGGNRFFVSAAEAFVFISGVTVGIVYGGLATTAGLGAATRKALARSWTLYAVAIWLGLAFAGGAAAAGLSWGEPLRQGGWGYVVELVTMRRTVYLVDVMLLYSFILLSAPLALVLLKRGAWWVVVSGSFLLWGAYQAWPGPLEIPWAIEGNPVFKFASWQVLAFTGIALGFERERVGALVRRLPRLPGASLLLLGAAFAGLAWLHATDGALLDRFGSAEGGAGLLDAWFDKSALPLPRLAACALVFGFAWVLANRLWMPLHALTGWVLMPFGRAALYAYAAHVVLILGLASVLRGVGLAEYSDDPAALPRFASLLLQVGALSLILAATQGALWQRRVAWLGRPPFSMAAGARALAALPRPAPSLAAVAAALLVAAWGMGGQRAPSDPTFAVAAADEPAEGAPAAAVAGARRSGHANPVTTVTASRRREPATVQRSSELVASRQAADLPPDEDPGTLRAASAVSEGPGWAAAAVIESMLFSAALGREMPIAVYLPPGYAETNGPYPVLYMLHGAGGGHNEWEDFGLAEAATALIEGGEVPPFIIVMPEGEHGYWANGLSGAGEAWGDYLAADVVEFVDTRFHTLAVREARAVAGLSRGGFGALFAAFTYPQTFGVVGAHSPSLYDYASLEDSAVDSETYVRDFDPVMLAEWVELGTWPRLWIDVGTDDDWRTGVEILHGVLSWRGIEHELVEWEGGHTQDYWSAHTPDYLRFFGGALSAAAP